MILIRERQVVKDKTSSVKDRFAGAKVFHGNNNEVRDLPNSVVQHLLFTCIVDLAERCLEVLVGVSLLAICQTNS